MRCGREYGILRVHRPIKCPYNGGEEDSSLQKVLQHEASPIVSYISLTDCPGERNTYASTEDKKKVAYGQRNGILREGCGEVEIQRGSARLDASYIRSDGP